jgi:cytidylate kinase
VQCAGISPDDENALEQLCQTLRFSFRVSDDGQRLYSGEKDIHDFIRTPEITMLASKVSAKAVVRKCLLDFQREMGRKKEAVFEGRDMGTVVFPDADVKFFVDADLSVRAKRRFKELIGKSIQSLEDVTADMRRRDQNDSTRSTAPLKIAADATLIDTTDLSIDDVIRQMLCRVEQISADKCA